MVWVQIKPDVLSGLIWVQTVYKGYQQTTNVTASKERVKGIQLNLAKAATLKKTKNLFLRPIIA